MGQRVQLFTASGFKVVTATVDMTPEGKWPETVRYGGHVYALRDGRYVRSDATFEVEAVEDAPEAK